MPPSLPPILETLVRDSHRRLDAATDAAVAVYAEAGGRIFCKAGCSNCCTLVVNATLPEALWLAAALSPVQAAAVRAHVDGMLAAWDENRDLKAYLRWHRQSVGPCPLLTPAGECGVYARRPLACRSLLATRPADWCGVDFTGLSSQEKELFMGSLDRAVVAFPTHYLASPQELGEELELQLNQAQIDQWGFSLNGNLSALLRLALEPELEPSLAEGGEAVAELLRRTGLHRPLLVHFRQGG